VPRERVHLPLELKGQLRTIADTSVTCRWLLFGFQLDWLCDVGSNDDEVKGHGCGHMMPYLGNMLATSRLLNRSRYMCIGSYILGAVPACLRNDKLLNLKQRGDSPRHTELKRERQAKR
jgi:hypothetical protein